MRRFEVPSLGPRAGEPASVDRPISRYEAAGMIRLGTGASPLSSLPPDNRSAASASSFAPISIPRAKAIPVNVQPKILVRAALVGAGATLLGPTRLLRGP